MHKFSSKIFKQAQDKLSKYVNVCVTITNVLICHHHRSRVLSPPPPNSPWMNAGRRCIVPMRNMKSKTDEKLVSYVVSSHVRDAEYANFSIFPNSGRRNCARRNESIIHAATKEHLSDSILVVSPATRRSW